MEIKRRDRLDLNTSAELAITNAMYEIEKAGADKRLTDAQNLLSKAKDLVSDYVDNLRLSVRDNVLVDQTPIDYTSPPTTNNENK